MRRLVLALGLFLLLSLPAIAGFAPSRDVAQVLARMEEIQAEHAPDDGIARFNFVYIATTRNLQKAIGDGRFADPNFMELFMARFADLYFQALEAFVSAGKQDVPYAWRPLFATHARALDFEAVQFVTAGIYAHIGRDLPVVLARLFKGRKSYPATRSMIYHDFKLVNTILGETFDQVRDHIFVSCKVPQGTFLCSISEASVMPAIAALRRKAWFDGHVLWQAARMGKAAYGTSLAVLDGSADALIRSVLFFHNVQ